MSEFAYYDSLVNVVNKNKQYLSGEIDKNSSQTINMTWDVLGTLRENIPEIRGGFGVGFPFHSISKSGELVTNPEFSNYSDKLIRTIELERSIGRRVWKCCQCQKDSMYHHEKCKECVDEVIKPRDVMKVMPDIDLFIISNDVTPDTLDEIQAVANDHYFHQSDHDPIEALQRIGQVFEDFSLSDARTYFPTDMHVISKADFFLALDEISNGNLAPNVGMYSMYYSWVQNPKIDFWFDFVFSGTFNADICDSEIMSSVRIARKKLATKISEQSIIDIIKMKSQRATVLLNHEPTCNIFSEKIRSWKNL